MSKGFLIDTNVLPELMRDNPATEVLEWFTGKRAQQLNTSVVTYAEILAGIALLPGGKRRDAMAMAASQISEEDILGRCMDFGAYSVGHYALVRAQRQLAVRPIDTADAQIAAIALTFQWTLVTRNTKDFEGIDNLQIINPWM
jgi:predicted nucleic acid-binding protein